MEAEAGTGTADMLQQTISRMSLGMPDGFLYGLNVRNLLSSVSVGYQDSISFASLPRPFACVSTDIYSQSPKYWTSGSLPMAMRSSMAIPLYFRSVRTGGAILLDGCMQNNFPVDIAREMGADIIIGSNMLVQMELNQINTPVVILFQGFGMLSSQAQEAAEKMTDLYVNHPLEGKEEPFTLVFECQKGQVNDIAVNIHADTDEIVYALLHLGLGTKRLAGPRLTTDIKLGLNPYLSIDASYKSRIGRPFSGVAQLDLRYAFSQVNYLTLRAGLFNDDYNVKDLLHSNPVYALGAEYSRQTIVGPFRLAVQWCDVSSVSAFVSIGFEF